MVLGGFAGMDASLCGRIGMGIETDTIALKNSGT
jgi:hypothetical protein